MRRKLSAIPSVEGGLPYVGQAFDMLKGSPWDTMTRWVSEYGTIYKFHLFGNDSVCIADPELLKVVLQSKVGIFKKDLDWTYKPFLVLLGKGLVTADGKNHIRQRALLSNYLRNEILEDIPDMAFRAANRLCAKLDKAKANGEAAEMAEEFRHLTLQVIAEAILSLTPEESDMTFAKMYLPIVEEGNLRTWHPERVFIPSPAWFRFRKAVKVLDDYVIGLILKRRKLRKEEAAMQAASGVASKRKIDVLDKVLGAIPDEEWGSEAITQICDELKTFILAGHETSASMLTWSLYELMKSKEKAAANGDQTCLQKVLAEGKKVYEGHMTKSGAVTSVTSLPDRMQLNKLEYTEGCLRESLRKYSVVPTVVRVASETVEVGPYVLPKGTKIMVCIQGVHHNPAYWKDPLEYRPERFLTEIQPYTFLPFVEGPRMCLGQFLSLLETKVVLSMLVQRYDFEIVNKEEAGLKHAFMVPIIPKAGHWMKVK